VQEGTHALDLLDPAMANKTRWSWEVRGHYFERQFQIETGMPVTNPDLGEMVKYVRSRYSNDEVVP
jgi:hypothetical protein